MNIVRSTRAGLFKILTVLMLVAFCQAKIFSSSFNLFNFRNNKGWNFIGRFTAQPTQLTIQLQTFIRSKQLKPQATFNIEISAIPSQFWQQELDKKCELSRYDPQILQQKAAKEIIIKAILSQQNGWHFTIQREIQISEPMTYTFVMRDCNQSFLKQGLSKHSSLQIKLQARNNDQHFIYNQFHNLWSLPLFIVLTYLILQILKRDREPEGDTWAKFIFKISLYTGITSISFKYADHLIYAYANGKHFNILDIMYLLFHALSDTSLIFIVIFVAFGWTITFIKHKKFDIWIPITLILSFVHIVITVINKTRDGHHSKFHMFDTFAGYIMVGFRIFFFLVFLYGIMRSYHQLSSKHTKQKAFFLRFFLFGTVYLTFLPLVMVMVQSVQQQHRHEIMALGVEIARFLLSAWFAFLIGWKHSSYREVASCSFIQEDDLKKF